MGSTEPLVRVIELSVVGGGGWMRRLGSIVFIGHLCCRLWTCAPPNADNVPPLLLEASAAAVSGFPSAPVAPTQICYPDLNGDTSGLGLFPPCEKALLSSCQSRLPPAAAPRAHASASVSAATVGDSSCPERGAQD